MVDYIPPYIFWPLAIVLWSWLFFYWWGERPQKSGITIQKRNRFGFWQKIRSREEYEQNYGPISDDLAEQIWGKEKDDAQ